MLEGTLLRPFSFSFDPRPVMHSNHADKAKRVGGRTLRRPLRNRGAFTLVEALVSMTITATAGAALLLGIASALQTTQSAVDQTIAWGLAEQMMDELASLPYAEPGTGPYQATLGPEAGESTASNRLLCDDLDDYNGLLDQPPKDRFGVLLGTDDGQGGQRAVGFRASTDLLAGYRREVEIYYVSPTDVTSRLPAGQTSAFRSVHVRVLVVSGGRTTPLVDLNRVMAYVPTP